MVLVRANSALGLPDSDETFDLLSDRLQLLVASGRLEGFGYTTNWRFSEVRLPD